MKNLKNLTYQPQARFNAYSKICPACNEKFTPNNRRRKFCDDYCKGVYHYDRKRDENKNQILVDKENKKNYKILKDFSARGINTLSRDALTLVGFNDMAMAYYGELNGIRVAIYNNFGLYFKEDYFHIIKITTWES